jgi:hypothetical protein
MTPKLEVSAKRILFFTKVILTFLVISILIFLNYMDLQESNRNRDFLCMLKDIYDLSDKSEVEFADYELERIAWLRTTNPALQKKHTDSRVELISTLNKYGASIGVASKGGGSNPNSIVLMIDPQENAIKKVGAEADALGEVVVVGYSSARSNGNVNMALDSFRRYESAMNVNFLTNIDSKVLVRKLDSILRHYQQQEFNASHTTDSMLPEVDSSTVHPQTGSERLFRKYLEFVGLFLQNKSIHIIVRDRRRSVGLGPMQSGPPGAHGLGNDFITVPAQTDSVMFPSILEFVGLDTAIVRGLAQNKRKQKELENLYGHYELNFIDNLSVEAFNKNNNAISILGFDISRKWFPIAMYVVLLVIYTMLYKTIRNADLSSTKIISGYESEETLDFLIDNKWIRFVIWVLTPVFLLFLVLYSTLINYGTAIYSILILAGISCLILGWMSYKKSLKL